MDRRMTDGRTFTEANGHLNFVRNSYGAQLSALFDVKVGAVSGADKIFVHPKGNVEFVCSTTIDTKETRSAYYDVKNKYLEKFKKTLLARRIRKFDETNWWMWGRKHPVSDAPRIYVNLMTRRSKPFFLHKCNNFDGSILALFPKDRGMDLAKAVDLLNSAVNWTELGFVCDGRFIFHQRSLQNCLLPEAFNELRRLHLVDTPHSDNPISMKKHVHRAA